MQKTKIIILMSVFVDVIGFGIVIPILPYYLEEFGAQPFTITLLFSVFSFCAFLSSPFLGALSDRIGRRPVLLLSIVSTSIGWFIFASAATIPILFLGRIIDGLAAGNFTTAQSYLVDIAQDDKERTANLGIVGATFGVGFMLGPLLGGLLSTISHSFPFYFTGTLALCNALFAYFMLPETNQNKSTATLHYNPFLPMYKAFSNKTLRTLYIVWFLFSFVFVVVQTIFALYTQHVFGFDSFQTGLLFTLIGVVIVVNQAALLKKFWLHRFTEHQLQTIMIWFLFIGLCLCCIKSVPFFMVAILFFGTGQAILRVVITSQAVGLVDAKMKGEIMGITASIFSFAMIISPIVSGLLFEHDPILPFAVSAAIMPLALFLSLKKK